MPRPKKETLKKRKDGRYRTIYKGIPFYGKTSDEAIIAREAYKQLEKEGYFDKSIAPPLEAFALNWYKNAYGNKAYKTKITIKIIIEKLINKYGYIKIDDIKPADLQELYASEFAESSNSYIKKASQTYKRIFDSAVENGYCKTNPARMSSAQPHTGYSGSHRSITETENQFLGVSFYQKEYRIKKLALV